MCNFGMTWRKRRPRSSTVDITRTCNNDGYYWSYCRWQGNTRSFSSSATAVGLAQLTLKQVSCRWQICNRWDASQNEAPPRAVLATPATKTQTWTKWNSIDKVGQDRREYCWTRAPGDSQMERLLRTAFINKHSAVYEDVDTATNWRVTFAKSTASLAVKRSQGHFFQSDSDICTADVHMSTLTSLV